MKKATIKKFYKGYPSYVDVLSLDSNGNPKFMCWSDRDFILRQFRRKDNFLPLLESFLSPYIADDKFEPVYYFSGTALHHKIDNYPYEPHIKYNIMTSSKLLCQLVEGFVKYYNENSLIPMNGSTVINTSAYRCKELNSLLGGSPTSLHLQGLAYDLVFDTRDQRNAFAHYIKDVVVDDILEHNKVFNYPILAPFELIVYENTNRVHIGFKYFIFNK